MNKNVHTSHAFTTMKKHQSVSALMSDVGTTKAIIRAYQRYVCSGIDPLQSYGN